jgi:hypothetical protein
MSSVTTESPPSITTLHQSPSSIPGLDIAASFTFSSQDPSESITTKGSGNSAPDDQVKYSPVVTNFLLAVAIIIGSAIAIYGFVWLFRSYVPPTWYRRKKRGGDAGDSGSTSSDSNLEKSAV